MKYLLVLVCAAAFAGCVETNRGGAHYGNRHQTGSGSSASEPKVWRSDSILTNSPNASDRGASNSVPPGPASAVDPSTGVRTDR